LFPLSVSNLAFYVQNGTAYFGGLIGRVANRISGARFTLDGKAYRLFPNDGKNTLHGTYGTRGFSFFLFPLLQEAMLGAVIGHLFSRCCSGGHRGFSKVVWTVKEHVGGGSSPFITLYYHSFDGEQGKEFWSNHRLIATAL
jgi:aldose 1-epimerase